MRQAPLENAVAVKRHGREGAERSWLCRIRPQVRPPNGPAWLAVAHIRRPHSMRPRSGFPNALRGEDRQPSSGSAAQRIVPFRPWNVSPLYQYYLLRSVGRPSAACECVANSAAATGIPWGQHLVTPQKLSRRDSVYSQRGGERSSGTGVTLSRTGQRRERPQH